VDAHNTGRSLAILPRLTDGVAKLGHRRPHASEEVSPASVKATLRVVRFSSLTPTRSSKQRTVWLNAEGETPSDSAARVKLSNSPTATKARN
jgi:hypothetical protein